MHRAIVVILVLLAACSAGSAQPSNSSIMKMGNGLTVILQEDHSAELIGIDVWVRAGSRFETPKNNGVSHFIEHLLFGVTQKRGIGQMDREMESLGATLDAHTSRDYTHFSTTVSSRYLSKALDIFSDAVNHSQFPEMSIARERPVILDEIARKETNPTSFCQDLLAKDVYGQHPYALPVEGTRQSVRDLSRSDILDYYHRYYIPSNIAVVLVGDIDAQSAISAIGLAFQGVSGAAPKEAPRPDIPHPGKQMTDSVKSGFKNNYLAIGFVGPPASEGADVCAMDVLLSYLGRGYHSWLTDELRTKLGLAQEATADFLTQHDPGLVNIIVTAKPDDIQKAKDAILAKIALIRTNGVIQEDVDSAKRSLLGQFAFQGETVGGRANIFGFYYTAGDPAFASKYADSVQAVTADAVMKVAAKYLDPKSAVVVTVGPDQGGAK